MNDALERYRWFVAALLALPLIAGVAYLVNDRLSDPSPLVIQSGAQLPADIRVYVTGAVRHPGVYPIAAGSRWIDALEAAGGATDDADLTAVNLAKRVQDEDQIVVPAAGQTAGAGAPGHAAAVVNLNTADQAALEGLPGIGQVRAENIIQSRLADGPFAKVEDLLTRKLVPDSVYQEISALVTVN